MANHFVAQFTERGGPSPQLELDRILSQTEPTDASSQQDTAWIPTMKGAKGWRPSEDAQCLVFYRTQSERIDAIRARVLAVSETIPPDPVIQDFYSEHEFPVWWKVIDVRRVSFASIDEIPGESTNGKPASKTFAGNQTFSFWLFGGKTDVASSRKREKQNSGQPCRVRKEAPALPRLQHPVHTLSSDDVPLFHGVDFSGGAERAGQGNGKIWIATWDAGDNHVTLESGAEGGFQRSGLPGKIVADKGWWVFDFPFGIARDTAGALQVEDWPAWLDWCFGQDRPEGYATIRRDAAKLAVQGANIQWSIRRQIDDSLGTTWFPLFEQLYRQTIYGATEVLHPLATEYADTIEILPWGKPSDTTAVVVEGFPGITIRQRLGLPATGYKGKGEDRLNRRKDILRALTDTWQVPVTENDVARAVNDTEGDAVDALVLLVACQVSHALDRASWKNNRERIAREGRSVEGWFPA